MADPEGSDLLCAFQSCYKELRAYVARRWGSTALAEEVAQDLYLRLRHLATTPVVEEPRAYLFRMAAYLAIDYLRVHERHLLRQVGPPAEDIPSSAPTPDMVAENRQQVEILQRAILELPARCRQVFLLHKGQGKSYSAIAAELGISIRTVEHHLARAMLYCRRRLMDTTSHETAQDAIRPSTRTS